jgi:hypothetical protein
MLALIAPLKSRLDKLPQLTGWDKRTNTEDADRSVLPAVDIRCVGATAAAKAGAVTLSPQWRITLMVERSSAAAEKLDAAMGAVICSLHGWQPGQHGGRGWNQLVLLSATEPDFASEGVVGYELTFSTAGLYRGQQ